MEGFAVDYGRIVELDVRFIWSGWTTRVFRSGFEDILRMLEMTNQF